MRRLLPPIAVSIATYVAGEVMTATRVRSIPTHRLARVDWTAMLRLARWRWSAWTGSKSPWAPESAPSRCSCGIYIFLSLSMLFHHGTRLRAKGAYGPTAPHLAQPPRPRVPIAPGHAMGLVANVGAANTIVHRDLLIALAQRWSSRLRIASSSVESRKVDRDSIG
jgi:hypothetical protein